MPLCLLSLLAYDIFPVLHMNIDTYLCFTFFIFNFWTLAYVPPLSFWLSKYFWHFANFSTCFDPILCSASYLFSDLRSKANVFYMISIVNIPFKVFLMRFLQALYIMRLLDPFVQWIGFSLVFNASLSSKFTGLWYFPCTKYEHWHLPLFHFFHF